MSAPAVGGKPTLRIRGTDYPVLLPTLRDPRLHLAAIIVTLQVLGQVAFDFRLSIAQILVSLAVAGILEVAIAFRSHRVLMWPASALLTGNGVAFVLRVPGTEHGDWWSMHGWWIFAGTSAVALLSKHLIRVRGRHIFNPSNFGLVLCFLLLGAHRADPLALWWGPLSPALVVALVLIVVGGILILRRLRLVGIAVGFWLAFAAGIGVLAASGHTMTAAWHVGPIEGWEFWWLLVTSPEILVFLFFMITDPKTIPAGRGMRQAYAVGVGLLATVLIAPQTTEFATKVAILAALFVACTAQGALALAGPRRLARLGDLRPTRRVVGTAALTGAFAYAALVVAAGIPARPDAGSARAATVDIGALPEIEIAESDGVAAIDEQAADSIARDVLVDLRAEAEALRERDLAGASDGASGAWLASLWDRIRASADGPIAVPTYRVARMRLSLRRGKYQEPPTVVANLDGSVVVSTHRPGARDLVARADPQSFRRTLELILEGQRYVIVGSTGGVETQAPRSEPASSAGGSLGGTQFDDVAARVGLTFRHGAFRSGMSTDSTAMMGGGLCWLDFDSDGWLDLFVVNSYADVDIAPSEERGGLPRSALFRNVGGRFEDVSASSGADLPLRGNGCVAADLNLDGNTDLYVTSAGYNVPTDGYDALLWNNGDGTFTEGAERAGITAPGWHSAAVVGDVDGNGRPDLFVTAYADPNIRVVSPGGFPSNHLALRDLLYLNVGTDGEGRARFREVSKIAGIERKVVGHGLGAVLVDVDLDGRLDLYVANDTDPNQLYRNVPASGGQDALGFRFEDVARRMRVDDPNAGMGIAAADFDRNGRIDLFVTNSRGQLHAAYRGAEASGAPFADARPDIAAVVGTRSTAWGDSWADFDLDGDLDLALANGGIPILNLSKDAQRIQILENVSSGTTTRFTSVTGSGLQRVRPVNGRGLATADFDNDGDLDIAVNTIGGRVVLLENKTRGGHWLEVRLRRFAPGAVVTAVLPDGRTLVRAVLAGSSYLSSEDPRIHFGLGNASTVKRLTVRFPDGTTTRVRNVAVDRVVELGPAR